MARIITVLGRLEPTLGAGVLARVFELAGGMVDVGARRVRIPVCAACGAERQLRYASPAGLVCARCQLPPGVRHCPADPHGQPGTTGTCPACRGARADHAIVEAVAATLGPVDVEFMRGLAGQVAGRVREREQLAAWLATHPDALTSGASAGPPALVQLLWELDVAGAAGVARARCAWCDTARRQLCLTVPGGRVCNRCLRRRRLEPCVRCGQTAPVAFRDTLGACCYTTPARACGGCGQVRPVTATTSQGPRCQACYQRPPRPCGICGELDLIVRKGRDGHPDICRRCYRPPTARCLVCGRVRPCVLVAAGTPSCATHAPRSATPCAGCQTVGPIGGTLPDGPRCQRCWDQARSRRGECAQCGATRRLFGPAPGRCGDCIGFTWALRCTGCGVEDRLYETGRCARCVLGTRLDALLGESVPTVAAPLRAVGRLLGQVDRPRSMLGWLQRSPGAGLLADLANGTVELSHQALDALPSARWVTHVRTILVVAGALPARQELLAGFGRWLDGLLATIQPAEDRWLLATFARTRLLPFLAGRQHRPRRGLVGSVEAAQTSVRAAAAWLGWLRTHRGRTLATCTQADLDVWLAGPTTTAATRRFIGWAQRGGLCPGLQFPKRGALTPTMAADADRRTAIVRTLLHQAHIPAADRVAGLLVTVYGQPLSRLVAVRHSDLTRRNGVVCLSRGAHWLELPDPLGTWAWSLRDTPAPSSVQPPDGPDSCWLFPGGLPGRPLRPDSLGNRLRRYGVTARAARNDALTDVAAAVGPITLASLLDMPLGTANTWAEASSGSWARYLDDLLDDDPTDHPDQPHP